MERMSDDQIDCCRRIGRDEEARVTTIGLAEIDALCAEAVMRGAERDAAEDAARAMRDTLCDFLDSDDSLGDLYGEVKERLQEVLNRTALHPADGKSWRGLFTEVKAWEHRALLVEAAAKKSSSRNDAIVLREVLAVLERDLPHYEGLIERVRGALEEV